LSTFVFEKEKVLVFLVVQKSCVNIHKSALLKENVVLSTVKQTFPRKVVKMHFHKFFTFVFEKEKVVANSPKKVLGRGLYTQGS
jgi:hypothetical protein